MSGLGTKTGVILREQSDRRISLWGREITMHRRTTIHPHNEILRFGQDYKREWHYLTHSRPSAPYNKNTHRIRQLVSLPVLWYHEAATMHSDWLQVDLAATWATRGAHSRRYHA
jgi:hypothetical protein